AVHVEIFDCEMKLNHPLAARAAVEIALKHNPSNESLRKGIGEVFGPGNPNLPKLAGQKYEYRSLPSSASDDRKAAWQKALAAAGTGKLGHAEEAFAQLAAHDEQDAAA